MPAVSIVVPCYNAADFIAEALSSVQRQTFEDWECIVVDDCSTDDSALIIKDMAAADQRIIAICLEQNGGASAARNAGFEKATGKWLTLLDADDAYASDRLSRLVALAEANDAEMVFDNQSIADYPSTVPVDVAFHWLTEDARPFSSENFFVESANFGRSINPGYMKPLFLRSFVEANRLRYDLSFRSGQDYMLYASAFAHEPRCFATGYCGYIYRRRAGSLSRSGGAHLRNHARLSEEILARYGERLSRPSQVALIARQRYFLRAASLHDVRVALRDRKPIHALVKALSHPGSFLAAAAAIRRSSLQGR
ncbi:glycosyltransferase family 2 protein [Novosphingobium cyanobacteriorum]|uniref:Glycosyltransferase family 2 protein n=1 Tax=Novosphingobium cyanobacteriorum TaxID=3024215 RepID=A0ABT6CRJ0_9SPHN|nr:glycosyltransferase family 2 protein [Novosphingobium cyanobacteriorum]MDF8335192.1 glycosyltransferase family 2 protein [Novosphingobium cyanobacteriorum]